MVSLSRRPPLLLAAASAAAFCCCLLLAVCSLPATSVRAAHSFDAYRLIQYDRGTTTYGSRRTLLNHQAIVPEAQQRALQVVDDEWTIDPEEDSVELTKATTQDLLRKVLVVRLSSTSPAKIRSLLSRGATGLLIVLPKDLSAIAPADAQRYKQLEKYLATHSWDAAIYFAFEDEYLSEMVDQLEFVVDGSAAATSPAASQKGSTDRYHIAVSTPDAVPLVGPMVSNFHGYQHASATSTAESENLPIIAVAASYDTIAAVPGLAYGLDQNGSGAIALLELSRIFHKLYSDFRTHGQYNLLFVLTALDRMNYAGTKSWLRNLDSRQVESIEFALCLERLATKPAVGVSAAAAPLYLHVSKLPKTPEVAAIYDGFKAQAAAMDIPLEVVHRKINVSNPLVFWPHEQFARKRIVAATLSVSPHPLVGWEAGSMFDGAHSIDLDVLKRNIEFAAEAIARHIYGLGKRGSSDDSNRMRVLDPTAGVNEHVLRASTSLFARHTRFTSFLQADGAKSTSPILAQIEQHFAKYTSDHKKQTLAAETLSGSGAGQAPIKLWKDKEGGVDGLRPRLGVVEMVAFQVKPLTFDLYLSGAIAVYLLAVYIVCQQPASVGEVVAVLIGR